MNDGSHAGGGSVPRRLAGSDVLQSAFFGTDAGGWYDVAPDDAHFLMAVHATQQKAPVQPELILLQNFFEELKARVPRN